MPHNTASDLVLQCLPMSQKKDVKRIWVNCFNIDLPRKRVVGLTLYLLVLSADDLCKQFGPRSGPTNDRSDLDPNCLTP